MFSGGWYAVFGTVFTYIVLIVVPVHLLCVFFSTAYHNMCLQFGLWGYVTLPWIVTIILASVISTTTLLF